MRKSELSKRELFKMGFNIGMKTRDLVEFAAEVPFEINGVTFNIPIAILKLLQHNIQEEVESCAN